MKAIELRAAYADALLRRGYFKLPEHPLVNREGEGPYFNGSALTPNIGYFLGRQQRPAANMFTQQRVFWTRFADLMSQRPAPIFTIFQVMMSYYQFEQPDLQEALDLGVDMLTDVLGLSRHDLLVLVPEQSDLGLRAQSAGALETNLVTWKQTPKFQVDGLLSGFYCKVLIKYRQGLLPILDIVNMYGPNGTLMVDSCMLLERMAFVLQGKRTWYETEMFLPLMNAIEEAEGSRVFDDLYGRVEVEAVKLHQERPFRAIIALEETEIIRAGRLRSRLGLRGQSLESAVAFRNKVVMKTLAREGGIPVSAFQKMEGPLDLYEFVQVHGYPVVVKPQ